MIIKKILNEEDIKTIICEHFDARPSNVKITINERLEGYGQAEHTVQYVEIEVADDEVKYV